MCICLNFLVKSSKIQECIPVGCVPSAAVAVGGVYTRHPRDQTPPPSRHLPGSRHNPPPRSKPPGTKPPGVGTPPVNRITDTCKNITFPQLRLRAVKIIWKFSFEHLTLEKAFHKPRQLQIQCDRKK